MSKWYIGSDFENINPKDKNWKKYIPADQASDDVLFYKVIISWTAQELYP